MDNLFSDLVIIDASSVLAGPSVGMFFAELGAKVIKVEHPKHPDVTRSWKLPSEDKDASVSAYFSSINYKKSYLKLDYKNPEDYKQLMQLIGDADIFLSNFKKGDDVKLQLTDEQLRKHNVSLIIGKINGFGSESERVAYDLILQAESGFMSMNGTPDSGPVKMPVALIDVLAAHQLKEALLVALYQRLITKEAKTVTVSLYEAAVASLVNQASNYLMNNHVPQRIGSLHPNIAPYGELFTTKDNAIITFAIGSDIHFSKLCQYLGLDHLIHDGRFIHNIHRVKNRTVLSSLLQEKIEQMASSSLLATMEELKIPAGKVKDLAEVFTNKKAQDIIVEETIDNVLTKRVKSAVFTWE